MRKISNARIKGHNCLRVFGMIYVLYLLAEGVSYNAVKADNVETRIPARLVKLSRLMIAF